MSRSISIVLLFIPFIFSCQNTPDLSVIPQKSVYPHQSLYLDQAFPSPTTIHIETPESLFKLDGEMLTMVNSKLTNNYSPHQKAYILLEHLFNQDNIGLNYQGNANISAIKSYHTKQANCMSLTIMAYALAKAANMPVDFQSVDVPEYWVRNGQYNLMTGHVNLVVHDDPESERNLYWGKRVTQIDFDPFVAKKKFSTKIISKDTLVAMFYNNRGAEEMVKQNYSHAYQYFKRSLQLDKKLDATWGNLGILYKLTGHYDLAEKVYLHAIYLNNNNLTSLGNLALLLTSQGRVAEAMPIQKYIEVTRKNNPYYHALLANQALFIGNFDLAVLEYKEAIKLNESEHEFYFGLAKAYYQLGNKTLAKRAIKQAIKLAGRYKTQEQYIAKLHYLQR